MARLDGRLDRLEQGRRRRLLQRLREAQTPREQVLAGQAVVEALGWDADPRLVAATLAGALDLDAEALLAEAEQLSGDRDAARALEAEVLDDQP